MKTTLLNIAIGTCMMASVAQALPTWPVSWNVVKVGGNNYTDSHYDTSPGTDNVNTPSTTEYTDITGNAAKPAAYYSYDGVNMYFRVRVDGNPTAAQAVWTAVLNTDTDPTADWVIQLDMKTDNKVELARAIAGSPSDLKLGNPHPWNLLEYDPAPHTSPSGGSPANWYNFVNTFDTDTFPDTPPATDWFVDFAFDKATFDATIGSTVDSLQVVFATSTTHINSVKDLPDVGWSDPITVPEPTSMALLALGVTVLAMRRRKI